MNDTVIGCFSPVVTVADRGFSGILVTGGTVQEVEEEEKICVGNWIRGDFVVSSEIFVTTVSICAHTQHARE